LLICYLPHKTGGVEAKKGSALLGAGFAQLPSVRSLVDFLRFTAVAKPAAATATCFYGGVAHVLQGKEQE